MKKYLRIFISLVLPLSIGFHCIAQKNNSFGITFGGCHDQFQADTTDPRVFSSPALSRSFGFTYRSDLSKHFSIETGLFFKNYIASFGFRLPDGTVVKSSTQSVHTIQFPLKLNYKINLYKHLVSIVPSIGYAAVFNLDPGGIYGQAGFVNETYKRGVNGNNTDYLAISIIESPRKIQSLVQSGMALEFYLFHCFFLDLYYNYYAGFNHMEECYFYYSQAHSSQVFYARLFSKGSYSNAGISLLFPFVRSGTFSKNAAKKGQN